MNTNVFQNQNFRQAFFAGIIIGLWLWLILERFIAANYALIDDSSSYFYWSKYFYNALVNGEYPLWSPFRFWGAQDNFHLRFLGELNPFFYLPMLLNTAGVPIYPAYLFYLVASVLVTSWGFYRLARIYFNNDRFFSTTSWAVFLFSSVSWIPFFQFCAHLVLAPMIWFAYFFLSYLKDQKIKFLWGMTFAGMMALSTYLPFYFMTVLGTFVIVGGIIFFPEIRARSRAVFASLLCQRAALFFAILAIGISMTPGILWSLESQSNEYFFDFRHTGSGDASPISLKLETANLSGLHNYVTLEEVFGWHHLGQSFFFYISILCFLMIAVTALNPVRKKELSLFLSGIIIFCLSVTDATPLHGFLFEHVYFFRLFRNNFFFGFVLIPILILFSLGQLQNLFNHGLTDRHRRWGNTLAVLAGGSFFQTFLKGHEILGVTSFVIFGAIILLLVLFRRPDLKYNRVFLAGLFALFLVEPIMVTHYQNPNTQPPPLSHPDQTQLQFNFTRPLRASEKHDYYGGYLGHHPVFADSSGFIDAWYLGTPWTYRLQKNIPPEVIEPYTRHKFIIYPSAMAISSDPDWITLKNYFSALRNTVFVDHSDDLPQSLLENPFGERAEIITEHTERFEVTAFGLNFIRLKTNFDQDRFLVYNDSFHSAWTARRNGQPARIYRTNYAFKGLVLPAGENVIELRYKSRAHETAALAVIIFSIGVFFYTLCLFLIRRGDE